MRYYPRTNQYSITALTDALGTIVERYAYDAYGGLSVFDGSGTARTSTAEANRYTFTGREWDEELDLYHFRLRMYEAVSGRFLNRDPIGYADGQNLYASYMSQNGVDPLGLINSLCQYAYKKCNEDCTERYYPGPGNRSWRYWLCQKQCDFYYSTCEDQEPIVTPIVPPGMIIVGDGDAWFSVKALLDADCDGVTIKEVYTEGIGDNTGISGIELGTATVDYQTYSDCIDGRKQVSHTGYIRVHAKASAGVVIPIGGGQNINLGPDWSGFFKFFFSVGPFDCGPCEDDC